MDQLQEVKDRLAELDPNNRDHLVEISKLKTQQAELEREQTLQVQLTALKSGEEVEPVKFEFLQVIDFEKEYGEKSINIYAQFLLDAQRSQLTHELHTRYQSQIESKDDEIKSLTYQLTQSQETSKRQAEVIDQNAEELHTLRIEREDFEKRFKNATAKIDEMEAEAETAVQEKDTEIKRLKDQVSELLQQIANAPVPAGDTKATVPNNMDLEAIRKMRENEKAAKPKIANLQWTDEFKKTHYKAIDETGETVVFPRLNLGQYNLVDEKELQFRQPTPPAVYEPIQTVGNGGSQTNLPVIAEPSIDPIAQFPSQTEVQDGQSGVDGNAAQAEVVGQATVTREEFEALAQRVAKLEGVA